MWWKLTILGAAFLWSFKSALLQAQAFLAGHRNYLVNWLRSQQRKEGRPVDDGPLVLLVTAHPDDECMFFTPAIRNFIMAGWKVHLLCMTTGNADGLGKVRREELKGSARLLGISQVQIHDDEANFPDSMQKAWDIELLSEVILGYLEDHPEIDAVLSFDPQGISGHPNHRDVCQGVRLALSRLEDPIDLYELESCPLLVKYISVAGHIYEAVNMSVEATLMASDEGRREPMLVASISWADSLRFTLGAMRQHKSQLVWFRWIYLATCKYCHVNSLRLKRYEPVK